MFRGGRQGSFVDVGDLSAISVVIALALMPSASVSASACRSSPFRSLRRYGAVMQTVLLDTTELRRDWTLTGLTMRLLSHAR